MKVAPIADLSRVTKPDTIRELGAVDTAALKTRLTRVPESVWQQENTNKENNYSCFHSTEHLVLRFIPGLRDPRVFYSNPLWFLFQDSLLPIFESVSRELAIAEPVFPKAMFARLFAGKYISQHTDSGVSDFHTHKVHVPLQTDPDVHFHIGRSAFFLEPGKAYVVNNQVPHSVRNKSDRDRIHLIFEVFDRSGQPIQETRNFQAVSFND